ncbi:hypothetical protein Trydic_g17327, partial [Trypoxylus dichotomus]
MWSKIRRTTSGYVVTCINLVTVEIKMTLAVAYEDATFSVSALRRPDFMNGREIYEVNKRTLTVTTDDD